MKDRGVSLVVGACVCWSRKTLVGIADVYRRMTKRSTRDERGKCEDRSGASEEVSTSLCLKEGLGIVGEEAVDDERREFFMTGM